VAKLERDLIFRVCDLGVAAFYDWERLKDWRVFKLLAGPDWPTPRLPKSDVDYEIRRLIECVAGLRKELMLVGKIQHVEYVCALLRHVITAIALPELSMQKRVFAIELAADLVKTGNRLAHAGR
jgi:hypothetical protein